MIRRIFKFGTKALLIILLLFALIIFISFAYHRIQLNKESKNIIPIGQQVNVNGHLMNVYSEGEGENTIVFMSGGGTCSPVLDFKTLYSELSNKYKIVVVEKAGYGFSEDSNISRDIDNILAETRQALILAGHSGPYILAPHSMSGIEALYWAQKYSNEVSAIIGLDMSVPKAYEALKINMQLTHIIAFTAKVGITRWIPELSESDAIKHGTLSLEEKELYKKIFYRGTLTNAMINEIKSIKNNAKLVSEGDVVDVPVLMFSSNGEGTGFDKKDWNKIHTDFINSIKNGKIIIIDSPHYIHNYEYKQIAKEIEVFISKLDE